MSDEIQVEGEELPHLLLVDDDATFLLCTFEQTLGTIRAPKHEDRIIIGGGLLRPRRGRHAH